MYIRDSSLTTGKPLYNTWLILIRIYLCSQLQWNAVQSEFAFGSVTDDVPPSPRLTETAPLFTSTHYDILDWKITGSYLTLIRKECVIFSLQGDILIA